MTTVAPDPVEHGRLWTDAYWLDHCEGCAVDHVDGGRLGFVESVVWPAGAPEPIALVVRLGPEPAALLVLPLDDVVEVCSAADRITVRSSAAV